MVRTAKSGLASVAALGILPAHKVALALSGSSGPGGVRLDGPGCAAQHGGTIATWPGQWFLSWLACLSLTLAERDKRPGWWSPPRIWTARLWRCLPGLGCGSWKVRPPGLAGRSIAGRLSASGSGMLAVTRAGFESRGVPCRTWELFRRSSRRQTGRSRFTRSSLRLVMGGRARGH